MQKGLLYLLHESECHVVWYFTSKLIYCQEPDSSEKKPECEICGFFLC